MEVTAPVLVTVFDDCSECSKSPFPPALPSVESATAKFRRICGRIELIMFQNELPVATTRIGAGTSQILFINIAIGWNAKMFTVFVNNKFIGYVIEIGLVRPVVGSQAS